VACNASSSGYYQQFERRLGWSWNELVQMLIEAGADVNAVDAAGRTPLQITGGRGPIADALRAAGAQ
jgi:ankyrin repeat protein